MTTILAFDCSTEYCSVALHVGHAHHSRDVHALQAHADQLIGHAHQLLEQAGLSLDQCDAIAFGAGPGSFTGLRVACAVAQGMAFGAGLPVIAIGTLPALAEAARAAARAEGALTVLCVQDARMGEAYWSVEAWDGARWTSVRAPALAQPDEIALEPEARAALGCGSGFVRFGEQLTALADSVVALDHPGADAIARLAAQQWLTGQGVPAKQARPLYVRDRVALTTEERAVRANTR